MLWALNLFISVSAWAVPFEKTVLYKQTICQLGTHKAELELRFDRELSPVENDYAGAPMLFLKSSKNHLIEDFVKGHPKDFGFVIAKEASACKGTQAFPLGEGYLAILYTSENRPFQSNYHVAVWDIKKDRIVEKRVLGAISEFFKDPDGFLFSTVIPKTDVIEKPMISPNTGKKMIAQDKDLEALQVMKLSQGKVKVEYDPLESYLKSNWRKYFKDKDEYLQAAGWNAKKKTFKNTVVFEGTHFDAKEGPLRESCILMTPLRSTLEETKWHCLQEENNQ